MLREELGEMKKEKSELVKRITTLKTGKQENGEIFAKNVKKDWEELEKLRRGKKTETGNIIIKKWEVLQTDSLAKASGKMLQKELTG
ncbi:hypothetical protein K0M31_001221 [Melipona bicolor]|uniref:Uncharacterized protein n=1 Tax=Melipona bicolor TaxID=60889 RepID=A0AA40GF96_9HYME|nr:hypothetical protein K0M31_001221 [Melipona bicolor]